MDELNLHQFWGISPFIDLLAATAAACPDSNETSINTAAYLQVCPYDCRHTLATISSHIGKQHHSAGAPEASSHQPCTGTAHSTEDNVHEQTQSSARTPQQLQLYMFETEPEVLARHMLLLAVLFDPALTVRERAETFLELHGNVMLRQKTADYLVVISKKLEDAVAQLSLCSVPAAATPQDSKIQQQQSSLGVLQILDLSLMKYQERDALLEAFQKCRQKSSFNMSKAWDDRCRKWYGDRYDHRSNMIDWDYHMRLAPRGTPFLDPALGSIIHVVHFRHWRLTGIAHELRGSSYTAANTTLLSTAIGRTKEFKDRQLRDVGRSVSAFGFWGDLLNSPYHAFGTVADDRGLFKVANKQFMHTAVDVAEHNILEFMEQLRSGCAPDTAATAAAAAGNSNTASSSGGGDRETESHRSNAARGPTSLENLTAANGHAGPAAAAAIGQQGPGGAVNGTGAAGAAAAQRSNGVQDQLEQLLVGQQDPDQGQQVPQQQQQQQQSRAEEHAQLQALEAAITEASVSNLVKSTKIHLLCGDLKRSVTSKSKFAGRFVAVTVGHRHVHMLSPEHGLASVLKPGAVVLVESGQNMVQLNNEQVMAFEDRVVELAAPGGFRRHVVLRTGSSGMSDKQQQLQGAAADGSWRLPPGHLALEVSGTGKQGQRCCAREV